MKKEKEFITILILECISVIGSYMTTYVLNIWTWHRFGTVSTLVAVNMALMLPLVVISPFSGILIDRVGKKRLLIVSNTIMAIATFLLLNAFYFDKLTMGEVIVYGIAQSLVNSLKTPLITSLTSSMVRKENIKRINGLAQSTLAVSQIFGPILGSLLLKIEGYSLVVFLDAISYLIISIPLFFFAIPTDTHKGKSIIKDLMTGITILKSDNYLKILAILDASGNLFAPFIVTLLLPMTSKYWISDISSLAMNSGFSLTSNTLYGFLSALLFIGTLIGGITFSWRGGFRKNYNNLIFGYLGAAISIIVAASTNLFVGIIGLLMSGFVVPYVNATMYAVLMDKVPTTNQGKVFTLYNALSIGTYPIGLLVINVLGDIPSYQILLIGGFSNFLVSLTCLIFGRLSLHIVDIES
ncbi:MFS transporter [Liquorilactobacillus uvarum]|uniref:Major facilitator superfamily (MFS) profile domain-containing protein n=1 Tax=Liquorilactobacillus uvarum DSM 19971 TaxID=1423812 RepID=A0A0R1PL55_9LACO|nr:MFS transporter [Liquorilactobacillus uvarum]KRL33094.1 hypothetical protein FD20_GL002028 [Liquorilactobacillus uvarum DSM 19971]